MRFGTLSVLVFGGGVVRLFLLGLCLSASAATPRLLDPVVSGNNVTLRFQADAGSTCRIEGSGNLSTWITVGSGVAVNGTLTIQHAPPAEARSYYYRGVVQSGGASVPFPTVRPVVSTNWIVSQVVVPEREALLRLEVPGGPVYSLRFPTNSFAAATVVRLIPYETIEGLPNAAGLLAGVRIEPEGVVPSAPGILQIDFPEPIDARSVSSFAHDNSGARLHLVPDVVVANLLTNRVKMLVNQLRSHGCGRFTLTEMESQATTVPPVRPAGGRAALQADLAGCYPEEQAEAEKMQHQLEDAIRPRQQAAAAILGAERQRQLLGTSTEEEGSEALRGVMDGFEEFYRTELEARVSAAVQKCAMAQTLAPWVLGVERQRQLLGVEGAPGGGVSAGVRLLCEGAGRCQQQALECCRNQGGDTRLIQAVLGAERQLQLLGGGECGGGTPSLEDVLKDCAPDWFGTLRITLSGRYANEETFGANRTVRTAVEDLVVEASVLSAKVKKNEANFFAPAYTNITGVMGGTFAASTRQEKVTESLETVCGKPVDRRRDVWDRFATTNLSAIRFEALIMDPGVNHLFFQPYFQVTDNEAAYDLRWNYDEEHNRRSEFSDEDCLATHRTGGTFEAGADRYLVLAGAKEGEAGFSWTADTIRYSFRGPYEFRFDFQHLYTGTRVVELELHRVR